MASDRQTSTLEARRQLQFEEIKYLRTDLLQSRSDLQRTYTYVFALVSILATAYSRVGLVDDPEVVSTSLLLAGIIFSLLALSYVGHMRHYLNVARYIEVKLKQIVDSFPDDSGVIGLPEVLNWELWNREFYKNWWSKFILLITWGMQLFFPAGFSIVSVILAMYHIEVNASNNWQAFVIESPILLFLMISYLILCLLMLLSLITALRELNKDVRIALRYFRYKKQSKLILKE